jgi:exodeoxyribonuclease VII small subunit
MASKQPAPVKTPGSEHTFESAVGRLEQIVAEMESEKLPLENLLTYYEEGTNLVKVCEEKLKAAEKRIEIITRDAGGEPRLSEFEPEKKAAAGAREDVNLF